MDEAWKEHNLAGVFSRPLGKIDSFCVASVHRLAFLGHGSSLFRGPCHGLLSWTLSPEVHFTVSFSQGPFSWKARGSFLWRGGRVLTRWPGTCSAHPKLTRGCAGCPQPCHLSNHCLPAQTGTGAYLQACVKGRDSYHSPLPEGTPNLYK